MTSRIRYPAKDFKSFWKAEQMRLNIDWVWAYIICDYGSMVLKSGDGLYRFAKPQAFERYHDILRRGEA